MTRLAAVPTRHTRLRRRLMDRDAAARGLENETCAADLAASSWPFGRGGCSDRTPRVLALDILRTQQAAGRPARLPAARRRGRGRSPVTSPACAPRSPSSSGATGGSSVSAVADGLLVRSGRPGAAVLPVFAALGELTATLL